MTALEEYDAIGEMTFWEALDLLKRMADELRGVIAQPVRHTYSVGRPIESFARIGRFPEGWHYVGSAPPQQAIFLAQRKRIAEVERERDMWRALAGRRECERDKAREA